MPMDALFAATKIMTGVRRNAEAIGKVIGPTYRRMEYGVIAKNLDTLMFRPSGSRDPLKRLSSGIETLEDKTLLAALLSESAKRVELAINELRDARDVIRERIDIEDAMKLDEIIYDKMAIRASLAEIARNSESLSKTPADAVKTLKKIEKLNREAVKLHRALLNPSAQAQPSTAKRKSRVG